MESIDDYELFEKDFQAFLQKGRESFETNDSSESEKRE